MKAFNRAVLIALACTLLVGCSSFKKLTGQTDNTVLPGEREDIIPADQQVNPPIGQKDAAADPSVCDPAVDPACSPAVDQVDQEASGDGLQ